MTEYLFSTAIIVHLAALLQVTGYLLKDQIKLRLLLLAGNVLYAVYYITHPATPLWDAMIWSAVMVVSNTILIVVILRERRHGTLDTVEREIYNQLGAPLPGHFRRIMKAAQKVSTNTEITLVRHGETPQKLFFIYRGPCTINLPNGDVLDAETGFVGELSLILEQTANATVTLGPGGQYLEWNRAELRSLFQSAPAIRLSFEQLLTRDIARKLAENTLRTRVMEPALEAVT